MTILALSPWVPLSGLVSLEGQPDADIMSRTRMVSFSFLLTSFCLWTRGGLSPIPHGSNQHPFPSVCLSAAPAALVCSSYRAVSVCIAFHPF